MSSVEEKFAVFFELIKDWSSASLIFIGQLVCVLVLHVLLPISYGNALTPILFGCICLYCCGYLLWRNFLTVLSPLPLLLGVLALFHCIGTLASVFGLSATKASINASYFVNDERLWRVILINNVGCCCLFGGFLFVLRYVRLFPFMPDRYSKLVNIQVIHKVARMFSLLGCIVYLGISFPASIGLWYIQLPGVIEHMGQFIYVAIVQYAFLAAKQPVRYCVPLIVLSTILLLTAVTVFMKESVVYAVVLPFVGLYLGSGKRIYALIGVVVAGFAYLTLVPIVTDCRVRVKQFEFAYGSDSRLSASFEDRLRVFSASINDTYFSPAFNTKNEVSEQAWWTRLCYNSPQAFAIHRYDSGLPGDSLSNGFASLIPRIIWPGKPFTASVGVEFQQIYTGRWYDTSTSVGIGIFGESYWLGGWLGVGTICTIIGCELGLLSLLAAKHIAQNDYMIFLPALGYGLLFARGIDRFIVMVFIGSVPIYAFVYLICYFVESSFRRRNELRLLLRQEQQ